VRGGRPTTCAWWWHFDAVRRARIGQRVGCHTLRRSFAIHLIHLPGRGYAIRTVQELPGHRDVSTIMPYPHVFNCGGLGARSALDSGVGLAR